MPDANSSQAIRHEETRCQVRASPTDVFDHIDRPERLSAHMSRQTWQLAGAPMSIETDAQGGRAVGSHIRLRGRMLGATLDAECVVTKRIPPELKEWMTTGTPRLLAIGSYRMEVKILAHNEGSQVTIAIDYASPSGAWTRLLWAPFARMYARWCVRQMASDLVARFEAAEPK